LTVPLSIKITTSKVVKSSRTKQSNRSPLSLQFALCAFVVTNGYMQGSDSASTHSTAVL